MSETEYMEASDSINTGHHTNIKKYNIHACVHRFEPKNCVPHVPRDDIYTLTSPSCGKAPTSSSSPVNFACEVDVIMPGNSFSWMKHALTRVNIEMTPHTTQTVERDEAYASSARIWRLPGNIRIADFECKMAVIICANEEASIIFEDQELQVVTYILEIVDIGKTGFETRG